MLCDDDDDAVDVDGCVCERAHHALTLRLLLIVNPLNILLFLSADIAGAGDAGDAGAGLRGLFASLRFTFRMMSLYVTGPCPAPGPAVELPLEPFVLIDGAEGLLLRGEGASPSEILGLGLASDALERFPTEEFAIVMRNGRLLFLTSPIVFRSIDPRRAPSSSGPRSAKGSTPRNEGCAPAGPSTRLAERGGAGNVDWRRKSGVLDILTSGIVACRWTRGAVLTVTTVGLPEKTTGTALATSSQLRFLPALLPSSLSDSKSYSEKSSADDEASSSEER